MTRRCVTRTMGHRVRRPLDGIHQTRRTARLRSVAEARLLTVRTSCCEDVCLKQIASKLMCLHAGQGTNFYPTRCRTSGFQLTANQRRRTMTHSNTMRILPQPEPGVAHTQRDAVPLFWVATSSDTGEKTRVFVAHLTHKVQRHPQSWQAAAMSS